MTHRRLDPVFPQNAQKISMPPKATATRTAPSTVMCSDFLLFALPGNGSNPGAFVVDVGVDKVVVVDRAKTVDDIVVILGVLVRVSLTVCV
jgi:hypothetical protein